jgi:RNA polymerase-interacting CarD/CdnL/TRCF family regulator
METQTPTSITASPHQSNAGPDQEYTAGTPVIYGLHGKCLVCAIENRTVGLESLRFYKLEVQKPAASRSTRQDPAIWVPTASARDRGMRRPMNSEEVDAAYKVLANREYYFSASESWSAIHPKLEAAIRSEGGSGLAKVISYLFVMKRKQVVPTPEVAKLYDQVMRLFVREASETTGKLPRVIETEINKLLRHKLVPDN